MHAEKLATAFDKLSPLNGAVRFVEKKKLIKKHSKIPPIFNSDRHVLLWFGKNPNIRKHGYGFVTYSATVCVTIGWKRYSKAMPGLNTIFRHLHVQNRCSHLFSPIQIQTLYNPHQCFQLRSTFYLQTLTQFATSLSIQYDDGLLAHINPSEPHVLRS